MDFCVNEGLNMMIKRSRDINAVREENGYIIKTVGQGASAFNNEIRALKILNGCCAPKLVDAYGKVIIMEPVKGPHLSDIPLNPSIMEKIARSLNAVHRHKQGTLSLIHGDLHRDNMIYCENGIVFLDFSESEFSDPLVDAAAVEIHIADDPKSLSVFYDHLKASNNRETINRYKIEHCKKHLEWAEKEGRFALAEKSRGIIKTISDGAGR